MHSSSNQRSNSQLQHNYQKGSIEHQRIFGESPQPENHQRSISYQRTNIFDLCGQEKIQKVFHYSFLNLGPMQIRTSSTYENSYNEAQFLQRRKKKRQSSPIKEQSFTQCKQSKDHGRECFFPLGKENIFYDETSTKSKKFIPQYQETSVEDKRKRDFINTSLNESGRISGKSKKKNDHLASTIFKNEQETDTQVIRRSRSQWKKQDFLQSSDTFSQSFQKYEKWKQSESGSPHRETPIKDTSPSLLIPTRLTWETFDTIKNQRDILGNSPKKQSPLKTQCPAPISPQQRKTPKRQKSTVDFVRENNYLNYLPQNQQEKQNKTTEKKKLRSQLSTKDVYQNYQVRQKSRDDIEKEIVNKTQGAVNNLNYNVKKTRNEEKGVEVVHLNMSGLNDKFSEDKFKKVCRDQGYHLVYCKQDYNKLTNKQTGNGSFMLRKSTDYSEYSRNDQQKQKIKRELNKVGVDIQERLHNNGFKDIVPNQYLLRQQEQEKQLKFDRRQKNIYMRKGSIK